MPPFLSASSRRQIPNCITLEAKKHYIAKAQKREGSVCEGERQVRNISFHIWKGPGSLLEIIWNKSVQLFPNPISLSSICFFWRLYIFGYLLTFFTWEKHLQRETDASSYPHGSFSSLRLWARRCWCWVRFSGLETMSSRAFGVALRTDQAFRVL